MISTSLFSAALLFVEPATIGVFLAVAFGFIVLAAAFFAFVMLRKTLKMAMRLVIVAALALIALVGSASFLWFYSSNGDAAKPRPTNSRSR